MKFFLALTALVPLAVSAADIAVDVGKTGLTFEPSSVTAAEGDVINFSFYPKNHTVTQSSFAAPCTPLGADGEDSDFIPVTSADEPTVWQYTVVNASAPLWFFCAQVAPVNHCTGGMVFAVNPTAERTFAAFQAAARAGGAPSSSTSAGTGSSTSSGRPSATAPGTTSSPSPTSGALHLTSTGAGSLMALVGLVAGFAL